MERLGENLERIGQGKSVSKCLTKESEMGSQTSIVLFFEGISGKRCQPGKNSGLSNLHVCNSQKPNIKLERELERNFGTEMVFLSILL